MSVFIIYGDKFHQWPTGQGNKQGYYRNFSRDSSKKKHSVESWVLVLIASNRYFFLAICLSYFIPVFNYNKIKRYTSILLKFGLSVCLSVRLYKSRHLTAWIWNFAHCLLTPQRGSRRHFRFFKQRSRSSTGHLAQTCLFYITRSEMIDYFSIYPYLHMYWPNTISWSLFHKS